MEYIVTCCSHEHLIQTLSLDIEGFIIGERFLSLNLPYTYTREELFKTIELIKKADKKVYIDMRTLLPNEMLPRTEQLLKHLATKDVTGVIFADQAIYMIVKEHNLNLPLVWGGDVISTNWYVHDFWIERGISHTMIAKELTKEAIKSIDHQVKNPNNVFELQGFGTLTMFHSRRNLLDNYYQHLETRELQKMNTDTALFLYDEERNNYYPIIEDFTGTHIFSPNDVCLIDEFEFLDSLTHFKYLKLDAKGHSSTFMDKIFALFIEARNTYKQDIDVYRVNKAKYVKDVMELYETDKRSIDKGFLYKPTIY